MLHSYADRHKSCDGLIIRLRVKIKQVTKGLQMTEDKQTWLPFRPINICPVNSMYVENTEGFFKG